MKLADKTVEVQSNIVFEKSVPVGIDQSAIAMVVERLISTYSNPYRAALREYSSNAYDEHIQAGVDRPVEVYLPNELSPVLKVQDFGRGLTQEELEGFGTIGLSTKRDSNETTGGFGMGSKCALAAASQFTVVSVKNGKRNTVIVARDENNVPHMNFLAEADTEDESGTAVIVPISDVSKFGDLTDFWVGWPVGTVLVDGEQPKRTVHDPLRFKTVGKGIAYNDQGNIASGRDQVRVLINQVYYILDYKDLGLTFKQWEMLRYYIIRIDNGSVDIGPSREDLQYNARTKAALRDRFETVLNISAKALIEDIRDAGTLREALTLRSKFISNGFSPEGLKWGKMSLVLPGDMIKGNRIPQHLGTWANPSKDSATKTGWRVEKNWGGIARQNPWEWNPAYTRFIVVYGASDVTTYGEYNNRKAHREAFLTGEYLKGIDADAQYNWRIFFTEEPLSRLNRVYRDLADSVISAAEFNAVAVKVRSELNAASRAASRPKASTAKLAVLRYVGGYGSYNTVDLTPAEIKADYDYTIILRNQIGGMAQHYREMFTTKKHYIGNRVTPLNFLRQKYKVAVVLTSKAFDPTDIEAELPPITTFEALAVKEIQAVSITKTKWELMAARDREKHTVHVLTALKDEWIDKIKKKSTREWTRAVRDYKDETSTIYSQYRWMSDPAVKKALESLEGKVTVKDLPASPIKRFPLIESLSYYGTKPSDLVDYLNMADAAAKA